MTSRPDIKATPPLTYRTNDLKRLDYIWIMQGVYDEVVATKVQILLSSNISDVVTNDYGNIRLEEFNPFGVRDGDVLTIPPGMGGWYMFNLSLYHPGSTIIDGDAQQAYLGIFGVGISTSGSNGVEWGTRDAANDFPDTASINIPINMNEGDEIKMWFSVTNTSGGNEEFIFRSSLYKMI